jgi:ribosomal protein L11 methyltransferase
MTADEWVDVQIRTSIDAGELLGLLGDPAVQGSWHEGGTVHLYWAKQHWEPDRLARLQQVLATLDPEGRSDQTIQIEPLPTQDWNRRWSVLVTPIRVGRRIVIRPSWEAVPLSAHDIEIILDPKQAFGTGHHATTAMLLEWLEAVIHGGERVLDVGTGSGILAMVALRLGAAKAVGLDHDPVAIGDAQDYARENHFGTELVLKTGDLARFGQDSLLREPFDLVLANLDEQSLVTDRDHLAHYVRQSAKLLVSGILIDQREALVRAYAAAGMYCTATRERDGWMACEFQTAEACEGHIV